MITLFSCESKYPGYIKKEAGVFMKLLSFEEGEKAFSSDNYIVASIEVYDKNELLYKNYKEEIIVPENNQLSFLIQNLNEGDSAIFKVSKDRMKKAFLPLRFKESSSDFVDVNIKIYQYYSPSSCLDQKESFDKEMIEQLILKRYIENTDVKLLSKIYKKELLEGEGPLVKKGDLITIGYKGFFTNGLQFDEISGATAFTFTYGTPGQIIKGLDVVIKTMREGEKSKIIIPSQLAFGEKGSTTLIIPPFATVIYELEILKISTK